MTPTVEELRRWSAELVGMKWIPYFDHEDNVGTIMIPPPEYEDWSPDLPSSPASQILKVIEKMRELGFYLKLSQVDIDWWAEFWKGSKKVVEEFDLDNPLVAILQAAYNISEETQDDPDR